MRPLFLAMPLPFLLLLLRALPGVRLLPRLHREGEGWGDGQRLLTSVLPPAASTCACTAQISS